MFVAFDADGHVTHTKLMSVPGQNGSTSPHLLWLRLRKRLGWIAWLDYWQILLTLLVATGLFAVALLLPSLWASARPSS
jgi:hypothetical protein